MDQHKYDEAVQQLETVSPYEKGQLTANLSDSCRVLVFLRGESFLALNKSQLALIEVQKNRKAVFRRCLGGEDLAN